MIECQSSNEFKTFAVGDRVEAKILQVTAEATRNWIELTRRSAHMAKVSGLDEQTIASTPMSLESLKVGDNYKALVLSCSFEKEQALNLQFSQPMQL